MLPPYLPTVCRVVVCYYLPEWAELRHRKSDSVRPAIWPDAVAESLPRNPLAVQHVFWHDRDNFRSAIATTSIAPKGAGLVVEMRQHRARIAGAPAWWM